MVLIDSSWFGNSGELVITINHKGGYRFCVYEKRKQIGIWLPIHKTNPRQGSKEKFVNCPNEIRNSMLEYLKNGKYEHNYLSNIDWPNDENVPEYIYGTYEKYIR